MVKWLSKVVHHNGGVGILTLINHQILLVKQFRYAQKMNIQSKFQRVRLN